MQTHELILIVDYGSQYTQLIARRIREQHVFCRIVAAQHFTAATLRKLTPRGVILSGGPNSVYQDGAPLPPQELFDAKVPTLGICYGMQAMVHVLGGTVSRADRCEYGKAPLTVEQPDGLFAGIDASLTSWMSHGDSVTGLPKGFVPATAAM